MGRIRGFTYIFILAYLMSAISVIPVQAKKSEKTYSFIVQTEDGTWETGSTENNVGFNGYGLMKGGSSTKKCYLDKLLDAYQDPSKYWKAVSGDIVMASSITENGSLRLDDSMDLYIYNGIAYNSNGAAYSNGYYFTVYWEVISEEDEFDISGIAALNPLSYVDGFEFTDSNHLRVLGADFYHLLMAFASAGMVFSLILGGIKLVIQGNRAIKNGLLDVLGIKILVFMALCAFIGIFGLLGALIEELSGI